MTDSTSKFLLNNPNISSNINIIPSNMLPDGLLLLFLINNHIINILLESTNCFSVEFIDNKNDLYGNDKKARVSYGKLTQYSINTINELPERSLDE